MMSVPVAFVVTVVAVVLAGIGAWIYRLGRRDEREELVRARSHVRAHIDADGCFVTAWTGQRPEALVAFTVPARENRADSRDKARIVLEAQGEEGAIVAEAVLSAYRNRKAKMRDSA